MKAPRVCLLFLFTGIAMLAAAQGRVNPKLTKSVKDTATVKTQAANPADTVFSVNLKEVDIVAFKTKKDWETYYKYQSRIKTVLPYVKIAKQLYEELKAEKENSKKRAYKHYRKDLEEEMRAKFEKELKDLSIGQGEMLFKLLNRETGNNAYTIIKELKGPMNAWFAQILAKRWGYDLKEKYDPEKEKTIELIIKQMGPAYNI